MKKKIFIIIVFLAFIFFVVNTIYIRNFSASAIIGKRNIINAKKIKIGMSKDSTILIMGLPTSTSSSDLLNILSYEANNIDYLDINISIDNENKVKKIFIPED
jgi:hypothetical protein